MFTWFLWSLSVSCLHIPSSLLSGYCIWRLSVFGRRTFCSAKNWAWWNTHHGSANWWLEDYFLFGKAFFSGAMLVYLRVESNSSRHDLQNKGKKASVSETVTWRLGQSLDIQYPTRHQLRSSGEFLFCVSHPHHSLICWRLLEPSNQPPRKGLSRIDERVEFQHVPKWHHHATWNQDHVTERMYHFKRVSSCHWDGWNGFVSKLLTSLDLMIKFWNIPIWCKKLWKMICPSVNKHRNQNPPCLMWDASSFCLFRTAVSSAGTYLHTNHSSVMCRAKNASVSAMKPFWSVLSLEAIFKQDWYVHLHVAYVLSKNSKVDQLQHT